MKQIRSERQSRRLMETTQHFLHALVIDFMYFVKEQPENCIGADKKVSDKFKEQNAKWKSHCHSEDNQWMKLSDTAFSDNVQRIAKAGTQTERVEAKIMSIVKN